MSLSIFKLLSYLNGQLVTPASQEMSRLDESEPVCWLVHREAIAREALQSSAMVPFNLLDYYKKVTRISSETIPAIESYFIHGPLALNGPEHIAARKEVLAEYRVIDESLEQWITKFSVALLEKYAGRKVRATELVRNYVEDVFKRIVAERIGCDSSQLPPLPGLLFDLLPRKSNLMHREAELETFARACSDKHPFPADIPPHFPWSLVTLVVMGKDALQNALLFGLHQAHKGDAEALFRLSAPVSVIARSAISDTTLGGEAISAGQVIYISPFLIGQREPEGCRLEFGTGVHLCAGKRISIRIANAFFEAYRAISKIELDTRDLEWTRNMILLPKEPA